MLLVCIAVFAAPATADAPTRAPFIIVGPDGGHVVAVEMGAAEGPQFPSLVGNRGDLRGWRNLQGGDAAKPNLDIGAGSTERPGAVVINYDIGRELRIYDGLKKLVARFGRDGIVFYQRPKLRYRK